MGDPDLTAVRRPFDAAFLRVCQAENLDLLRDELSNMLHHMYRLSELCRRRWQVNRPGLNAKVVNIVPDALGAIWIRRFDTHEIAEVSTAGGFYSGLYTEYGVAVWKPVAAMPFVDKPENGWPLPRYKDYEAHLETRRFSTHATGLRRVCDPALGTRTRPYRTGLHQPAEIWQPKSRP
jgi:hypothetical protein